VWVEGEEKNFENNQKTFLRGEEEEALQSRLYNMGEHGNVAAV
jgi:hypothetical protein